VSARSWWLKAGMTTVGLPAVGVALAVSVIDPNDYKPQVADAVRSATGRELTLGGPLRVGFSLWPTIEISDVKLANLPGGSRPDMARIERIQARLSLSDLLWRRVEVNRLTLIGPNILFELVNGQPNWVFRSGAEPGAVGSIPSRMPVSLRVRDFRVRNGMITSRMPARTNVLGIRTLRLQHSADEGPIELAATFVYSDYQPFDLKAHAQPTMGLTGPWATQLEFVAYDAKASAKGTISIGGDYDLRIDATAPALEKLNALLPEMKLPALHQTTISTRVGAGIDRWLTIIRLHSRDACRRSGQLEGSRLSSTMADRTTLMSVKIHALQIQRGPPPQNTEGEVQSHELAGIRRGSGPAGKPHGLGDR
jgi:hypothetical protein